MSSSLMRPGESVARVIGDLGQAPVRTLGFSSCRAAAMDVPVDPRDRLVRVQVILRAGRGLAPTRDRRRMSRPAASPDAIRER